MTEQLPRVSIKIDRGRAIVRGLCRLGGAVIIGGLLLVSQPDWGLLWQTQRATCVALGAVFMLLAATGAVLALSAVKWLLLSGWPGRLGIKISPDRVQLSLGPFGERTYDWARIRLRVDPDIDPAILDTLADDAFATHMRHPDCNEDLASRIQRFGGLEAEALNALLRPYLTRALIRHAPRQREERTEAT